MKVSETDTLFLPRMDVASIDKEIKATELKLSRLHKDRGRAVGRKYLTCTGCAKKTQIQKVIFLQTHHYTPPRGCTGGDSWTPGEGNWVCSKCGYLSRLYDRDFDLCAIQDAADEVWDTHGVKDLADKVEELRSKV